MEEKKACCHKTSIGGQALIEGVMMRGPRLSAMATRMPDQSIDTETWENKGVGAWYKKVPLIRGIFNLVDSLVIGYTCLMKSAEKSGMDLEDEEPGKFEKWLTEKLGDNMMKVISGFAMVLGVVLALLLFMVIPTYAIKFLDMAIPLGGMKTALEGILKIAIFVLYLALVARMPDIRRVFEYHGAEHKTIACYEAGEELTVENVRKYRRFHPRCGTSFILIVLIISIIVFSFVPWGSGMLRVLYKIILLPVVVGIAYEIIKLAGRYDNILTRIISAPGLWLQHLTTNEPHDDQIEVAIASMLPVIPETKDEDKW
ncbi:DUF1385 domain-containing protein [Clostridiaceae bacterium NSJ-31]|uniref:DUF1385 domain-containing protein n=1 Tax=Ligaoa zhengdingensis TaxID=2763658 RepID=A0A926I413_9FIRM|nr:DUF1385 domain-containing protein [Ligaoa zhengdingensis]MBC8545721.1 DUF1385 domain-containing protein [Ligaoa zhengdingensis]